MDILYGIINVDYGLSLGIHMVMVSKPFNMNQK